MIVLNILWDKMKQLKVLILSRKFSQKANSLLIIQQ